MAITINGDGSITGVSVGGLPDGIVDTDMIAADAVTDAKQSLSGAAKAWVNFNGESSTAVMRSYFNVASITDEAAGDYTVVFTNAMPNADYCVSGAAADQATGGGYRWLAVGSAYESNFSKTVNGVRVQPAYASANKYQAAQVYVVIHGD